MVVDDGFVVVDEVVCGVVGLFVVVFRLEPSSHGSVLDGGRGAGVTGAEGRPQPAGSGEVPSRTWLTALTRGWDPPQQRLLKSSRSSVDNDTPPRPLLRT